MSSCKFIAADVEERLAIGFDEATGKYFLAIPVSNGMVDYEEYYEIDEVSFEQHRANLKSAIPFAKLCKQRLKDDLLILKPGRDRGFAT